MVCAGWVYLEFVGSQFSGTGGVAPLPVRRTGRWRGEVGEEGACVGAVVMFRVFIPGRELALVGGDI